MQVQISLLSPVENPKQHVDTVRPDETNAAELQSQ